MHMLQLIVLILIIAVSLAFLYYLSDSSGRRLGGFRSSPLKRELLRRVSPETAERLVAAERAKHPGKSEHWYLEKVLYDLKRGR